MLIKNAAIYALRSTNFANLEEELQPARYQPIASNQMVSQGFSPVFEDQLIFRSNNQLLLKYTHEKKVMPKSAIESKVAEKAREFEEREGHLPGKKARRELRERVVDELLPTALATKRSCLVWIDTVNGRVIIDSTSNATCDDVIRDLLKYGNLDLAGLEKWPGPKVLTVWLTESGEHVPYGFTVDDTAALQVPGERGTVITFKKAYLHTREVEGHLGHGAQVTALAMSYKDRLSFVITPNHQLRRIRALDLLDDVQAAPDVDRFENDFILATSEIADLINTVVRLA